MKINNSIGVEHNQNVRHVFDWPIIDAEAELAVLNQLKNSISLYKKEGIYKEFEDAFAAYHSSTEAVVFNSGTTALWAAYGSIGLKPGDEVLVPTYTFFATISPMIQWGLVPIFCDCNELGNFEPSEIGKKVSSRTRAVIVTHMWGVPCDMPTISRLAKEYGLILMEDCSHAHGATVSGKMVGTWGDVSAWSLQGKKLVPAGQGGILVTRSREVYERAVFLGHFNKRCYQEISAFSPLSPYNLTGAGMNLRPSPLAIALANQQFRHLNEWITQKRNYVSLAFSMLKDIPCLDMPKIDLLVQPVWYGLVMRFKSEMAICSREEYVRELNQDYGLGDIDIPMSTCPNHLLPLFARPFGVRPDFYSESIGSNVNIFPKAKEYFESAIKLFIPVRPEDKDVFEHYLNAMRKVGLRVSK